MPMDTPDKPQPEARAVTHSDIMAMVRDAQSTAFKPSGGGAAQAGQGFQSRDFAKPITTEEMFLSPKAKTVLDDIVNKPRKTAEAPAPKTPEVQPEPVVAEEQTAAEPEMPPEPAGPTPEEIDALRQAAFDEGHAAGLAAGMAQGRAEAEAEATARLAEAHVVLDQAVAALSAPGAEAMAALTQQITEAVQTLASQRAGAQIDKTPKAFVQRIEKMAGRIAEGLGALTVRLNPDDLTTVRPLIEGSVTLAEGRLIPAPHLSRGDLDIQVGDVRLNDILRDQAQ